MKCDRSIFKVHKINNFSETKHNFSETKHKLKYDSLLAAKLELFKLNACYSSIITENCSSISISTTTEF